MMKKNIMDMIRGLRINRIKKEKKRIEDVMSWRGKYREGFKGFWREKGSG